MFPTLFLIFLLCLSIFCALAIKYEWLHGKPVSDEETVKRYLAKEKTAIRMEKIGKYIGFLFVVFVIFIFLYWTFGRFVMWIYYIFFE